MAVVLWLTEGTSCWETGMGLDGQADGTGCATSASVPAERCDGPRAVRALRYLALPRWHMVTVGLHFPLVAARLRAGTAPSCRASSSARRLRPAASPTLCCHGRPQLPHTTQGTPVPTPLCRCHSLRSPGSLWVVMEAELAFLPEQSAPVHGSLLARLCSEPHGCRDFTAEAAQD